MKEISPKLEPLGIPLLKSVEIHIPQHQTENKAGQQGDQDTKGGRRREKKQPVSNEKHYIKDRRWT